MSIFITFWVNFTVKSFNNLTSLTSCKRNASRDNRSDTHPRGAGERVDKGAGGREIVTKFAPNVIIMTTGEAPFYKDTRPKES